MPRGVSSGRVEVWLALCGDGRRPCNAAGHSSRGKSLPADAFCHVYGKLPRGTHNIISLTWRMLVAAMTQPSLAAATLCRSHPLLDELQPRVAAVREESR